jgi:predicted branched-subunit amino acid permease
VVRRALSVGVAVGLYGVSFGAAAAAAGLSVPQACALSLLVFTGASQFALVGVLGAGGGVAAGVASAVLLGTRNALYGVVMADRVQVRGPRRIAAAHVTIDESTAVGTAAPPHLAGVGFWWAGLTVYVLWNLSTFIGALGSAAVDTNAIGLDGAVGAAFLGLVWPRLTEARWVALGGAVLGAIAVPLTPPGVPVLVAGAAVLPALVRRR